MNKYLLISSVCAGWLISVSAGADSNVSQTEQPALDSVQMSLAIAAGPEQTNTSATTPEATPPSTKGRNQKDEPYVTPQGAYNNNGVFGN